ncbi:uncharacterized protein LOC134253868 [Saccostrea cucullata]|uniref:uncharacterized protein LOC134253868 n=1 Tax=Saccostrea cuccullata TaxID=36930 RepID=UPI002ED1F098
MIYLLYWLAIFFNYHQCQVSFMVTQFYHQDLNGPYCRLMTSILFHLEENFFLSLTPHLQLSDPIPLKKPAAECELDTSGRDVGSVCYRFQKTQYRRRNGLRYFQASMWNAPVEPDIPGPSGVNQSPITVEPPDSAPVLSEPETSQAKVNRTSRRKGKGRGKQRVDKFVAK